MISAFLAEPALPHVFQVLRGCLDGDQSVDGLSEEPETSSSAAAPVTADSLLVLLHLIESSRSCNSAISLLAEDMLSDWLPQPARDEEEVTAAVAAGGGKTIAQAVQALRKQTAEKVRARARERREKQLRKLNMRVDESGQVSGGDGVGQ